MTIRFIIMYVVNQSKYVKMNAHAHIVKEHMVIGATVKSTR